MGRGTEAFPDLGEHCEHEDCRKLDFLPFTCDGCHKVFCLEHRTSRAHGCPKSDHDGRMVAVCGACSASMEREVGEEEEIVLERHGRSGECDPAKKQRRSRCPVSRCKQILTLSNTSVCGGCRLKVCLKHRFPSDHACRLSPPTRRGGTDCRSARRNVSASPPAVEAC